ncbi:MAG: protein-disulfide reductase DsbD N-terminal domain-containing protein [Betaproteobacteria bacterium]|nr:protein-disulfide reductase DsbD N-terminal domain-containing protein [Betaproteobacteria bacterium]
MKPNRTLYRRDLNRLVRRAMILFILCQTLAVAAISIRPARAVAPNREPDLLEAEKAFAVRARLVDAKTLELRFAIANGYYMYRDRFRFAVNGQPVSLSRQAWPTGKWKQDASFGKVVTYRHSVRLLLPLPTTVLDKTQSGHESLTLAVSSQGCADAGICYPPLRQTLALAPGSATWVTAQGELSTGFSHGGTPGSALSNQLTGGK